MILISQSSKNKLEAGKFNLPAFFMCDFFAADRSDPVEGVKFRRVLGCGLLIIQQKLAAAQR